MQELQDLSVALVILSKNILGRSFYQQNDQFQIAVSLLLDIDRPNFQIYLHNQSCQDFSSVKRAIETYYQETRGETIAWSSEMLTNLSDQFIQVFVFILDLALQFGRDHYIEEILRMNRDYQVLLQSFMQSVIQRQLFIVVASKNQHEQIDSAKIDNLIAENDKLKYQYQNLSIKYKEITQKYEQLRSFHQDVLEQNVLLKNQRLFIINQFSANDDSTIEELVASVKQQQLSYYKQIQKLQKQIQEKNNLIEHMEEQIRQYQHGLKEPFEHEIKIELLNQKKQKISLQNQLISIRQREEHLIDQLQKYQQTLSNKQQLIDQLTRQNSNLLLHHSKYEQIRNLHTRLKPKLLVDLKSIKK